MTDREFDDDLVRLRIRRDQQHVLDRAAALSRVIPSYDRPSDDLGADPAGERAERLQDRLRVSEVRSRWSEARAAPEGPVGEGARGRFRLLAAPYLDRAVHEEQAELDARRATLKRPPRGFEFEIVQHPTSEGRREIHARWVQFEERLAVFREEVVKATAGAARRAGAASTCDFLAAGHPVAVDTVCERFQRGAIAPLDDAVERAARDRRLRSPLALSEPEHPADSLPAASHAGYAERFPAAGIPAVLRSMGTRLGLDPDSSGPGVLLEPDVCEWPRSWTTRSRGFVLIGALDGPGALAAALDAFGRAGRCTFLGGRGDPTAPWSADPAFEVAAGTLFARLLVNPAFRARYGPRPDPNLDADLGLEFSLAPRLGWTYVYLALRDREAGFEQSPRDVERALRRALGRPASVDQGLVPYACDPRGAAELRGTVLALLLEERLASRWGREWFVTDRAGRFLRECWEAEAGQTAESVADGLDLGTIEPTPILDGCRPR